jgi:hypothetical protein
MAADEGAGGVKLEKAVAATSSQSAIVPGGGGVPAGDARQISDLSAVPAAGDGLLAPWSLQMQRLRAAGSHGQERAGGEGPRPAARGNGLRSIQLADWAAERGRPPADAAVDARRAVKYVAASSGAQGRLPQGWEQCTAPRFLGENTTLPDCRL